MFLGQTHFGKLFVELYFLKKYCVVTLLYMIIYEKRIIFNIACIWGNVWFVSMEEISIFDITIGNGFYGFIALFANSKDVLFWLVIFGKLIENVIDKKWFWKIWEYCEYIGYFKDFCETTWDWIVFWFYVNCELFMFLPLGHDMWLPGDYPARCRSLCDIGILAPHLRGIIDVFVA